jgi:carotenoid cleavage dioxygenase-like enzyme
MDLIINILYSNGDGVLDETNLYIINATTMETISKSKLPTNIPVAIHGRFFPDP